MLLHLTLGLLQAFLALVHRLCSLFNDKGLVASFGGVDCSALDAVVERKAADEHTLDFSLMRRLDKPVIATSGLRKGGPKPEYASTRRSLPLEMT